MTRIAVTGIDGFLGWHARVYFHSRPDCRVLGISRALFADPAQLSAVLAEADVVFHLGGMNRGPDEEIERVNVDLTRRLIAACGRRDVRPHVVFANSAHCVRETAYGRSKRYSAELLSQWAARTGATFTNLIIPNVFGEGGRPFYNSVIATFCHQLASGLPPEIIEDGQLELVHAQTVISNMASAADQRASGDIRLCGTKLAVSACLEILQEFDRSYRAHLIPSLSGSIDLDLFNVYRSYLYPQHYPVTLPLHSDARGDLFEVVKSLNGGQTFISTTKPGITRGNHYHAKKVERFVVLKGEALIRIRKLFTKEVVEFKVSGAVPQYIDMPTFATHSISNTGTTDLTTLFWAHEIFDPRRPDTVWEPVEA